MNTYQPVEVCYAGPPPLHWLLLVTAAVAATHHRLRRCTGAGLAQKVADPTFLKSPCPKEEIPRIVLDSRFVACSV